TATPCPTSRSSRRPTTTASSPRTASACSASTPATAPSTRAWHSATATPCSYPAATTRSPRRRATTSTTSTSWPGRRAPGPSPTTPTTNGCCDECCDHPLRSAARQLHRRPVDPRHGHRRARSHQPRDALARVPLSPSADVDAAVQAARAALPAWRAVSVIARSQYLFALREGLRERKDELARSVTTEMGKTLVDATAEVARMIEMVEA